MIRENQFPAEVVRLAGVTKKYHGNGRETLALDRISFQAGSREVILLLGPSGSGKSTFLTILAGLQPPSTGEVFLFGKKIKDYTQKEMQQMRANRIGFVFQTFYLIDSLTALENILLVLKFNRIHGEQARDRAMDLLSRYEVQYLARTYPLTMSQGEKQRVALARALANDPELIIADEPTGSLATSQGMKIVEFLHESAHQDDRCVIIASHDQRIAGFADRVLYLRDGVLIP